jgi:integrase
VGTVFARKNSDGKTRYYVCLNLHGQRYREVAGDKKSVAQKRLRELEDRLDRGGKLQDSKVPFNVLCNEYLEWALVNLAPRTRREREIVIKAHLKPFFTCLAGDIGVKEIELYKTSRDKAGIAGITLNTELKAISGILRFGVELGYLLAMPKIRRLKVSTKKPRHLSKEEIFKVLEAARPDRRPLLQLMTFSGLRKGEIAHLEWPDIDFDNRVLHVQPKGDWTPKGGDPRTIPLNNHALDALRQARSAKERRGDRDTNQLVFPGRKGHLNDIRTCLNGACDRAGVPRVHVHGLRHTFGSIMAMEGADPFSIQKAMGHKDIKTTMIYVDMSNPHIRDQVDKLNGIVIPGEKRPKSAPNDIPVEKKQKKGTRKKPDSLSDSEWCRRRDLNPHGFPHHPLKKLIVIPMEAIFVYKSPSYNISRISLLQ